MADRSTWDAQFGTGLRSQYDFTIHVATFGTDAAYNNGETYLLILTGEDEDGEVTTEQLSLGEGWETFDGGFTVKHEKKAIVNKNSVYGKWCAFAADAITAAKSDFLFDKNPLEAAIWAGTKWHLEERVVGEAFTGRDGTPVPERKRLMPVSFLGMDTDPVISPVAASEPSKRDELLARANAAAPAPSNGLSPAETLKVIAQESSDFSTFVNAALALDSVTTDETLAELVIDSGPNGFYTLNH